MEALVKLAVSLAPAPLLKRLHPFLHWSVSLRTPVPQDSPAQALPPPSSSPHPFPCATSRASVPPANPAAQAERTEPPGP